MVIPCVVILRSGMWSLDKANQKATIELYLIIKMLSLSSDECKSAFGMLASGLSYHDVICHHGYFHQAVSSLASWYNDRQSTHDSLRSEQPPITHICKIESIAILTSHLWDRYCMASHAVAVTLVCNNQWISNSTVSLRRFHNRNLAARRPYMCLVLSPVYRQNRLV